MSREPLTDVRSALQAYANRGVFREFSERAGRGGKTEFRFTWLTRAPITLVCDTAAATLTFKDLLPDVARASPLLAEVQELVGNRASRSLPAHRRVEGRRVRLECVHRRRNVSIVLHVKGRHHAYAVQKGVNLVNEIFTLIHASFPDYLWEQFALPAE